MWHFPTCEVEITCFLKFTPLNFFRFFRKKVFLNFSVPLGKPKEMDVKTWFSNRLKYRWFGWNSYIFCKRCFFNICIHMAKQKKIQKKVFLFLRHYKIHFPINNGWKFKKTQNKFISFTIVNTKSIVLTTVNSYCFSMILRLIMVCLRIVPFSVCFTI